MAEPHLEGEALMNWLANPQNPSIDVDFLPIPCAKAYIGDLAIQPTTLAAARKAHKTIGAIIDQRRQETGKQMARVQSEIGSTPASVMKAVSSGIALVDIRRDGAKNDVSLEKIGASAPVWTNPAAMIPNVYAAPPPPVVGADPSDRAVYIQNQGPTAIAPSNRDLADSAWKRNIMAKRTGLKKRYEMFSFSYILSVLAAALRGPMPSLEPKPIAIHILTDYYAPLPFGFPVYVNWPRFGDGIATHYMLAPVGNKWSDQWVLALAVKKNMPFGAVKEKFTPELYAVPAAMTARMPVAITEVIIEADTAELIHDDGIRSARSWVELLASTAPEVRAALSALWAHYPNALSANMLTRLSLQRHLLPSEQIVAKLSEQRQTRPLMMTPTVALANTPGASTTNVNIITGRPASLVQEPQQTTGDEETTEGEE